MLPSSKFFISLFWSWEWYWNHHKCLNCSICQFIRINVFFMFIKSVLKPSTMSIRLELYIYNSTVLSVTIASIHDHQQSHFALFYPKFDRITFQCALILKPTLQLVKPTLQFVSIAKPHFQLCLKSSSICTCSKLYNIPKNVPLLSSVFRINKEI